MTDFHPDGYDICFENVGFSYEQDKTVLRDVSFTAKQGQVTALVGPSGGGKTTVSRLATRFWDVTKGRITVGGQDISLATVFSYLNSDLWQSSSGLISSNPGFSGRLPIRSIPYSLIQFHQNALITSINKDSKGSRRLQT